MVAWSLAKTPFHECHVVEMGDPGQFFLSNVFGEMKLPTILMGNRHPLHQARDNLCREEGLAITGSWYNAMFQGYKLFVEGQRGLHPRLQQFCGGLHMLVLSERAATTVCGGCSLGK